MGHVKDVNYNAARGRYASLRARQTKLVCARVSKLSKQKQTDTKRKTNVIKPRKTITKEKRTRKAQLEGQCHK